MTPLTFDLFWLENNEITLSGSFLQQQQVNSVCVSVYVCVYVQSVLIPGSPLYLIIFVWVKIKAFSSITSLLVFFFLLFNSQLVFKFI